MALESFPFDLTQGDKTPQQTVAHGNKTSHRTMTRVENTLRNRASVSEYGGKARSADDSGNSRFEKLMAEYAPEKRETPGTPVQQSEKSVPESKPVVLPQELVEIMEGEEIPLSMSIPGAIDVISEKAQSLLSKVSDFLGEEAAGKLSSLLSSVREGLKSGELSGLASLLDNAAKALEELADNLELNPEAAEDLKDKLAAALNGVEAAESGAESLTDEVNSNGVKPKSAQDPFVKEKPKSGDADDDEEEAGTDMKEDDIPLEAQAAAGAAAESGASGPTGDTAKANDNGGFELPDGMEKTNEPLSKQDMNMANRPELQQSQAQKGKFQAERPKMDAAGQRTEENTADTEGPRAEDNVTRAAQPGDNSNQSRGENGGDGSNNNTGARTESRARADVQRRPGEARASDDERIPTERTNTANVRTDFQSFFEGVLSSRRTGTTPAPMSLSYGTAALPERSEMLSNGVTNVVRFVRADGLQRANIVIEPPSLGRVTVELTSSTSGVEASIRVSNEQVRQLVQDQISQLRMNLEQQGVQVTQFAVDVQQDNGGQGQNSEQDGQRRHGRRVGAIEEAEETPVEEFRVDLEQGLLHWVA